MAVFGRIVPIRSDVCGATAFIATPRLPRRVLPFAGCAAATVAIVTLVSSGVLHAGTAVYTYDVLGRLTTANTANSASFSYEYDALGNFVTRIIATPPSAPPTITGNSFGIGTVTFQFIPPTTNTGSPITGYVASCSPGALSATVSASATSITVSGLTKGSSYTCTLASNSAVGPGPSSSQQAVVGGTQTLALGMSLSGLWVGVSQATPFSASSGLPVSLASSTSSICSVVSGVTVRGVAPGNCMLNATQAGDTNFLSATPLSVTVAVRNPAILFLRDDD